MTVVAAVVGPGGAWMLGDSCVTGGDELRLITRSPKVARSGPWLVGAAGDAGACTALLARPLPVAPAALLRALRRVEGDWEALLARPGELWVADSDGSLERVGSPYWAIGSGGQVCLGALAGLTRRTPERLLRTAAGITARYRGDGTGPYVVVSV